MRSEFVILFSEFVTLRSEDVTLRSENVTEFVTLESEKVTLASEVVTFEASLIHVCTCTSLLLNSFYESILLHHICKSCFRSACV